VSDDCLKLTSYFGERDRAGDRFVADLVSEIYDRHGLATSVVMRGVAGFGAHHHVHTDRQLTLSEDLPVVSVAIGEPARIETARAELESLRFSGLITVERAQMQTMPPGQAKLTIYVGRQERADGRPAYRTLVDELHDAGVAGATVLLGVDGTLHGARRRARFFSRNEGVPLMVISVGDGEPLAHALARIEQILERPVVTFERIQVCKRDGALIAEPTPAPAAGLQKLMVYAGEQAHHDGHPLYVSLLRRLRAAGAAGATSLRGIWGYHGNHMPHGDTLWQLRRRVPVVTVVVDTPERTKRWFEIVDEVTAETGLVTSEAVPTSLHRQPPA
jgi:PII-like signaling protein